MIQEPTSVTWNNNFVIIVSKPRNHLASLDSNQLDRSARILVFNKLKAKFTNINFKDKLENTKNFISIG